MCQDNLTEFSRQAPPLSRQEDGVRTVTLFQVSGKKALKAFNAKRKLQEENKENIPPILHREEAFTENDDSKGTGGVLDKEEGHHDCGKHVSA